MVPTVIRETMVINPIINHPELHGILLSCGYVDLNDGKAGKVRLWNWFGAESDTIAALQALIDG